jgi:hypothetical protein
MQASSIYNRWAQFIEMLRKKCGGWANGILLTLAEEEMTIRRQELDNEITAHSPRD